MKAKRLAVEAIAAVAAEGVERARQARALSAAEIEEVGGAGMLVYGDIRPYGGKLIRALNAGGLVTSPIANQLGAKDLAGGMLTF
jgi:hypothetical protein